MDNEVKHASKFTYVLALHKPYEPEIESARHSVSTVIADSMKIMHICTKQLIMTKLTCAERMIPHPRFKKQLART